MKLQQYSEYIGGVWAGRTAQEICSYFGTKLNSNTYNILDELVSSGDYEVYEIKHNRYTRKKYRKKLPKFELGALCIYLVIILWQRQDWISIEELEDIIDKKLKCDIIDIMDKLEFLKECSVIIEDGNTMFFRIKVLDENIR